MISYAPVQSQTIATSAPTQADTRRRQEMQLAWDAYRGKLKDPLKVKKGEPNDNVRVNRCGPVGNKGASFLFGQVLKIECDEQDELDAIWGDDDDKMTMLVKLALNGAACGQTFVKLIPARKDGDYPRMVIQNPMNMRIITLPDDCETHIAYIIEYPVSSDLQKKQIISCADLNCDIDDITEQDIQDIWTITNYTRKGDGGFWVQKGELEEWLYPFPPIFCCQNLPNPNESWGIADLTEDLIEANKVLNFLLSNISRIVKYHGHPKTWASGIRAAQIQVAVDETLVLESPEAKLEALSAMENFSGLLSVVEELCSFMDEESRIPAGLLGRMKDLPKGNISGVVLKLLFQTLIEITTLKQRLYGRLIRDISRAALVLCEAITIEEYKKYQIKLNWQPVIPSDDLQAAQVAILLQQLNVSMDTIMSGLGLNAEDEMKKKQDEDQKKMDAYSKGQGLPPTNQPPGQQQQQTIQQDSQMQQKDGMGNE